MSGWIDETFVLLCELISFNPEGTTAIISFLLMWMETGREVEGIAGTELLTTAEGRGGEPFVCQGPFGYL